MTMLQRLSAWSNTAALSCALLSSLAAPVHTGQAQVKSIRNLNGHSIAPYQIHAGKSVPIVKVCALRWSRVFSGAPARGPT